MPVTVTPGHGSPVEEAEPDRAPVTVTDLPEGVSVFAASDQLRLSAWSSTVGEQMLARGDLLVLGLGTAAASLLLVPILRSVAAGRPFEAGNSRRIAGLAVVVVAVAWVGPFLNLAATVLVLHRLGLDNPLAPSLTLGLNPLLLAALLLVLAESFRRGEQISREADGLV